MKLFFIRHAEAEERGQGEPGRDEVRRLTKRGRGQAADVGAAMARMGFKPSLVLTSPLVRARQTAEIVASAIGGMPRVDECAAMAPGGGWAALRAEIEARLAKAPGLTSIAVVGHQPGQGRMILDALGARGKPLEFRKGAVVGLRWDEGLDGIPEIFFAITPKQAARFGE